MLHKLFFSDNSDLKSSSSPMSAAFASASSPASAPASSSSRPLSWSPMSNSNTSSSSTSASTMATTIGNTTKLMTDMDDRYHIIITVLGIDNIVKPAPTEQYTLKMKYQGSMARTFSAIRRTPPFTLQHYTSPLHISFVTSCILKKDRNTWPKSHKTIHLKFKRVKSTSSTTGKTIPELTIWRGELDVFELLRYKQRYVTTREYTIQSVPGTLYGAKMCFQIETWPDFYCSNTALNYNNSAYASLFSNISVFNSGAQTTSSVNTGNEQEVVNTTMAKKLEELELLQERYQLLVKNTDRVLDENAQLKQDMQEYMDLKLQCKELELMVQERDEQIMTLKHVMNKQQKENTHLQSQTEMMRHESTKKLKGNEECPIEPFNFALDPIGGMRKSAEYVVQYFSDHVVDVEEFGDARRYPKLQIIVCRHVVEGVYALLMHSFSSPSAGWLSFKTSTVWDMIEELEKLRIVEFFTQCVKQVQEMTGKYIEIQQTVPDVSELKLKSLISYCIKYVL